MSEPKETTHVDCMCINWARSNPTTFTGHHEYCQRFDPAEEIRRVVIPLLDGIEKWARDEDGVHYECWPAYQNACLAIGEWGRLSRSNSSDCPQPPTTEGESGDAP